MKCLIYGEDTFNADSLCYDDSWSEMLQEIDFEEVGGNR